MVMFLRRLQQQSQVLPMTYPNFPPQCGNWNTWPILPVPLERYPLQGTSDSRDKVFLIREEGTERRETLFRSHESNGELGL